MLPTLLLRIYENGPLLKTSNNQELCNEQPTFLRIFDVFKSF